MTLGRQDIEKRDFPTGRRGYDPEAVDRHLREVASEVEALRAEASSPDGAAPLAAAASEQVRTIVAAGEKSAEEIRRQAADEADRTRTQAATQAREHVERVSAATAAVLRRLEAIESELGALFEGMRGDAGRIRAELAQLQEGMGELRVATGGGEQGAGREEPQTDQAARAKTAEPVGDEQPTQSRRRRRPESRRRSRPSRRRPPRRPRRTRTARARG